MRGFLVLFAAIAAVTVACFYCEFTCGSTPAIGSPNRDWLADAPAVATVSLPRACARPEVCTPPEACAPVACAPAAVACLPKVAGIDKPQRITRAEKTAVNQHTRKGKT